jgi:hypothetical protein
MLQYPSLPRPDETRTMSSLILEGSRPHLESIRPGTTIYDRCRAYETVGCAFTRHPHPGELGRR